MSKYTTEVRYICESEAGLLESEGYNSIDSILTASAPKIFSFDFPIFDEEYRLVLEKKILKHYYTREIGLETYGLWKLFLDKRLNEIMPYYNKLYESELLEFNPLYDSDFYKTHQGSNAGETKKNGNEAGGTNNKTNITENKSLSGITNNSVNQDIENQSANFTNKDMNNDDVSMYSETPQGALSVDDLFVSTSGATYLTNAKKDINKNNEKVNTNSVDNSSSKSAGQSSSINNENNSIVNETDGNHVKQYNEENSISNSEQYIERVYGKLGIKSSSKLLMEFRETFLNIDMMIINELKDLFMLVW